MTDLDPISRNAEIKRLLGVDAADVVATYTGRRGRPPAWSEATRDRVDRRLAVLAARGHNMRAVAVLLGWKFVPRPDKPHVTRCITMMNAIARGRRRISG